MSSPAEVPHAMLPPRDVTPPDRQPPDLTPRVVESHTVEPPAPVPTTSTDVRPKQPGRNTTVVCRDWSDRNDRYEMIAEAAYFKAEKRGFGLGDEELDWLEAERELTERMEGDHVTADD